MKDKNQHMASAGIEPTAEILATYSIMTPQQKIAAISHLRGGSNVAGDCLSNPVVKRFLSMAHAQKKNLTMLMDRDEARRKLARLARINLSDVVEIKNIVVGYDDRNIEVYKTVTAIKDSALKNPRLLEGLVEIVPTPSGVKFKMHDQRGAIRQLAEMNGWNSAQRLEFTERSGGPKPLSEMGEAEFNDELKALGIDELQ